MKRCNQSNPHAALVLKKIMTAAAGLSLSAVSLMPAVPVLQQSVLQISAAENTLQGQGTQTDPWQIATPADLVTFSQLTNSDASMAAAYYELTADLDLSGIAMESIGRTHSFSGVFEGNGHRIYNLNLSGGDQTGLFSFLDGGAIRNLGLENATVTGGTRTGLLVGRTMHAEITNCYVQGTVQGANDVGGLVGMTNNTLISNCFALVDVTASGVSAGGLSGSINRSIDPSTDARVTNCYAWGSVSGSNHVGSVIGYDESVSGNAYFVTMDHVYGVEGMNVVGNNAGREGVETISEAALSDGTLLDKLNAGLEEGWQSWMARLDGCPGYFEVRSECGLFGNGTKTCPWLITEAQDLVIMQELIDSDASYADDVYALHCDLDLSGLSLVPMGRVNHFSGTLDGNGHVLSHLNIVSDGDLTGLFGFVENGTIQNLTIQSGTIAGISRTGALAGRTMKAQIYNCLSNANVSGTNDIGGLVGMLNNTRVRNCASTGTVSGTDRSIGGLAGSANRSLDPSSDASFENCWSAADVSGPLYVGSIVGYDETSSGYTITLDHVYGLAGQTASGNTDRSEVTQLSSEQMRDGTLIGLLNDNRSEGDQEWLETGSGLPGFQGKVYIETSLNGQGTEESPYLIGSVADLQEMSRIVSLSAEKADAWYELCENIDFTDQTFNGIEGLFTGSFNGKGFALQNLNIQNPNKAVSGLFHSISHAHIQNVLLESGEIFGNRIVGGIAGKADSSIIENCMVYAKVRSFDVAGGLVGELNGSTLSNCASNGKVQCPTTNGGLAGSINKSSDGQSSSSIRNSYTMGHPFWGTYEGKIAGTMNGEAGQFENVYYSDQYEPHIGLGSDFNNTTAGITMKTRAEMESQAFVDQLNQGLEEGSGLHWVLGADGKPRLDLFEEAAAINAFIYSIQDQPEVENGRLVPPVSEDGAYRAVLAGSDNRATVTLDGHVYTPLRDQQVLLIYDIEDTSTGEIKGRVDRNIVLDVKGTYEDEGAHETPMVIPGLREWHGEEGYFTLSQESGFVFDHEIEEKAAGKIQDYLDEICPFTLRHQASGKTGNIVLQLDETRKDELGSEGYTLVIGENIIITAAEEKGLFYGGISVAQILSQEEGHTTLPKGEARDYPADELRGGMFEVGRRYFELDYIEDIGKYMAWFKMNSLHLHLNEMGGEHDSSFVLQNEKYPAINDNNTGYIWSKDDYRQMQKNLHEVGVDVISEIDTPGHSAVFAKVAPELVSGANLRLGDHYDECLALIESVFDEYLDGEDPVFQHAIVNIGTDESANTKEDMRRYINDLAQYCLAKDNVDKVEFWGNLSLYYGNTEVKPENVIERIWDGPDQRVDDALENGYLVTNSTSNMMYIVPGNGLGFFSGYLELDKFYEGWKGSSDFCTSRIPNPFWIGGKNYYSNYTLLKGDPQILGSFFCDWNDSGWGNDYDIFEIMRPYIGAMSEKGWYGEKNRFASGKAFEEAFETLGDTGVISNPRRHYEDEDLTLAAYDFAHLDSDSCSSSVLDRPASIHNGTRKEETFLGESISTLGLHKDTSLSLPFDGVGYPYTVTMEMKLDEAPSEDAVLFEDDFGAFHANYKGNGVCFTMGKYTYTFNVNLPVNEWFTLSFTSNYTPGGTPVTRMKLNGRDYSCSLLEKVATNANGVPSSYLPTTTCFSGLEGSLKSLTIRNAWNLMPNVSVKFEGEGTEESPYRIETAMDLQRFLDLCSTGNLEGKVFALYNDLDLHDQTILPAASFNGILDGRNHVISGLKIDLDGQENVGLICQMNGGTIRNLRLKEAEVTGGRHTGVLVGRTDGGTLIENVRVDGTVKAAADGGLLVGMFNNSTLRNCGSTGSVSVSIESVGGLTGSANNSVNPSIPVIFDNCWSAAHLEGRYAGRITGWDESSSENYPVSMSNCHAMEGKWASGNYERTDGIVWFSESELTDGTLLARLNDGLKEGMESWIAAEDGTPDFESRKEQEKVNTILLEQAVAMAEGLQNEASYEKVNALVKVHFEQCLEEARTVLADESASQSEVNEAWRNLSRAIQILGFTSDFTTLDALLAKAEALNLDDYEEPGRSALEEAIRFAREVRESDTALNGASITEAENRLQAALDNLVPVAPEVDTTLLELLVETAEGLNLEDYTSQGQEAFTSALEEARAVLEDPEDQNVVDAAVQKLNLAMLELRLKPSESLLKALQGFLDQTETLNAAAYAPATWNVITMFRSEVAAAMQDPDLDEARANKLADRMKQVQELINHPEAPAKEDKPQEQTKPEKPAEKLDGQEDKTAEKNEPANKQNGSEAGTNIQKSASVKSGVQTTGAAAGLVASVLGFLMLKKRNRKQ